MNTFKLMIVLAFIATNSCVWGQYEQPSGRYDGGNREHNDEENPKKSAPVTPPVAILKQINRHHEDGSYTYGFEGADGSFKIETKSAAGDVRGKYGFIDAEGKIRTVEYGANQHGFQPAGEGITVPPPTLVDETTNVIQQDVEPQNYQNNNYPPPQYTNQKPRPIPQSAQNSIHPQSAQPSYFTPSAANLPNRQSQQFDYEQRPPASQVYNQGPVQFNPSPNHGPPPSAANPVASASDRQAGPGILDQLARDYALPNNAAPPLHDISFGFY